jgi:hypothetical protein
MMSYRYREAAHAYADLEQHFSGQPHNDVADDAALARILANAPAQKIVWDGPVRLTTSRNPLGHLVSSLDANGVREEWLLDSGANQSVVSRSFAARLGLTPLAGSAWQPHGSQVVASAAILRNSDSGGTTIHQHPF